MTFRSALRSPITLIVLACLSAAVVMWTLFNSVISSAVRSDPAVSQRILLPMVGTTPLDTFTAPPTLTGTTAATRETGTTPTPLLVTQPPILVSPGKSSGNGKSEKSAAVGNSNSNSGSAVDKKSRSTTNSSVDTRNS